MAKGPRMGNRHEGVSIVGTVPRPWVFRVQGAEAPLSPTRARTPAPGPTAVAAPMPSAGERLQSVAERSAHPPVSGRRGRGGGVSELDGGARRDVGTSGIRPAGPGAPLPGAQVRPAVCAEVGTALAR